MDDPLDADDASWASARHGGRELSPLARMFQDLGAEGVADIPDGHEISAWLRAEVLAVLVKNVQCGHLGPANSDAVLFLPTGNVACGECIRTVADEFQAAGRWVCDRCGEPAAAWATTPDVLKGPNLLNVFYVLCADCWAREFPGQPVPA